MVVTGHPWVVAVAEIPELDCRMVLFAHDEAEPFGTLEIQDSFAYDELDRALGKDCYCLVVDGGEPYYGGLERWEVTGEEVRLELTPPAAAALGLPRTVRVPCALQHDERHRVRRFLREMVGEPA